MSEQKKEEIKKLLANGRKSSSEISILIGWNYWKTQQLLEELLTADELIKIEENKYVYWEIKNG